MHALRYTTHRSTTAMPHGPPQSAALPVGGVQTLTPARQHPKRFVPSPPVDPKVPVQRQNIRRSKLVRQPNQAGIGQVDLAIPIFAQDLLDASRSVRKLKRNLEYSGGHIFDHRL